MSEHNVSSATNPSQRGASTTSSDDTPNQVHSPPRSYPALTHNDKVLMLILLLQQETGVPIPGTAPNKQRKDDHAVSPRNTLNVEEASRDRITCTGVVASAPPLGIVADGDDGMSMFQCYWADSESNNDTESGPSSPHL
jgi:hypothetical protein